MSLNNILGKPTEVNGFGNIYPVKLKDWDEFEENLNPIILSKGHLLLNIEDDIPLLDRLILGLQDDKVINALCKVFNIITYSKSYSLYTGENTYEFRNENNQIINSKTYELIRPIILRQNILFEPKIYKNPAVAQWAAKVLEARAKNAPNVTLEDKLSTVSIMTGKHYWDLEEYTMFQLSYEFNRICKIKNYETQSLMFVNPYADLSKFKLEHFAENVDMYEDPYKDIFKSKDQLKISKAIQG